MVSSLCLSHIHIGTETFCTLQRIDRSKNFENLFEFHVKFTLDGLFHLFLNCLLNVLNDYILLIFMFSINLILFC
jgi:hypothetical protein